MGSVAYSDRPSSSSSSSSSGCGACVTETTVTTHSAWLDEESAALVAAVTSLNANGSAATAAAAGITLALGPPLSNPIQPKLVTLLPLLLHSCQSAILPAAAAGVVSPVVAVVG